MIALLRRLACVRTVFFAMLMFVAAIWGFSDSSGASTDASIRADRVVVVKSQRKLYLLSNGSVVRDYDVALGRQPKGHKRYSGDGRTPEGTYFLARRNDQSRFYRSIEISYPNLHDRAHARANGRDPGGEIMIHGVPGELESWGADHALYNWTEGCIAVLNQEMDEIWDAVEYGTPIEIKP